MYKSKKYANGDELEDAIGKGVTAFINSCTVKIPDSNLNNVAENGFYNIEDISGFSNIPDGLTGNCQLIVMGDSTAGRQTIITHENIIYTRDKTDVTWGEWHDITGITNKGYTADLDTCMETGLYSTDYATNGSHRKGCVYVFLDEYTESTMPIYQNVYQVEFSNFGIRRRKYPLKAVTGYPQAWEAWVEVEPEYKWKRSEHTFEDTAAGHRLGFEWTTFYPKKDISIVDVVGHVTFNNESSLDINTDINNTELYRSFMNSVPVLLTKGNYEAAVYEVAFVSAVTRTATGKIQVSFSTLGYKDLTGMYSVRFHFVTNGNLSY